MESTADEADLFEGIYYVMPNFALYSFRTETANGLVPSMSAMLLGGTAYALIYCHCAAGNSDLLYSIVAISNKMGDREKSKYKDSVAYRR
jgi:hypothetical protein